MPLRQRLAWVSASAVALAVVIAAIVCYMVVRSQLLGQVDSELQQQASLAQHDPQAFSGENGIALQEYAPFGLIGVITPVTHSLPTLACNAINMLAAGNAIVCNPHPDRKSVV